jgi:DsbC/DsbD-like thiol-disulfide interchange protein
MRTMNHAWSLLVIALSLQAGTPILSPPDAAPKHLRVATSASAASAAPGAKVSLFVDVTPAPGIHVYAPGAKDFLPIAVALDPATGATIGTTVYPKSETIASDDDRVPVFQKAFRLTAPVSIASSARRGTTITIKGKLNYQACDDAVCFIPASVPVSWNVAVK